MGVHSNNSFRSRILFLPKRSSLDLSPEEKRFTYKPVRHVGMGIDNPVFNATFPFHSSQHSTRMLVEAIKTGSKFDFDKYKKDNNAVQQQCRTTNEKK